MRIETGFLRSVVARRVFLVLLAAAALPLLMFGGLAYGTLADRMEAALHSRLQDAAKYGGLQVYDRLVLAHTVLAALASSPTDQPPGVAPLAGRDLFRALATVRHDSGRVHGSAELASTWELLASDPRGGSDDGARRLWWLPGAAGAPGAPGAPARVLMGVRDDARWWIAELMPEFLWGDLRDPDALVATCVTDARGQTLMCPQNGDPGAAPLDGPAQRKVSWSLFTRAGFGSIDWVFTRRSAQSGLHFGDLPVEQLAWKAVLFSLLLVLGLSLVLVRRTTVPLERLLDGTRRLARRDWTARVEVCGGDEFGELARSFNEMAGHIERQVQALKVQSAIDREILTGLDVGRVLQQVRTRLQSLVPDAEVALLLQPDPAGCWQWVGADDSPSACVSLDDEWWRRLQGSAVELRGPDAVRLCRQLGLAVRCEAPLPSPAASRAARPAEPVVQLVPATAGGGTRALLVTVGTASADEDLRRELADLSDRLAVMLVAADREQQLRDRAVHDSLTGLLNRSGLIETLDRRLQPPEVAPFVLAFIDLDGFKTVNDRCGHPVGDALLCQVAALLRSLVPPDTVISRPGGDEFVLLLPAGRDAADQLAGTLCRRLAQPFVVDGQTLHIGASLGLVHCPDDGRNRTELMRRADLAMYAAKSAGRAQHAWFDAALDERSAARAWVQAELALALLNDQLCLHFQPRVRAGSGQLASVEALVRWPHPQRGLIPPMQFVPVAEETGQVVALGRWVLGAACEQLRRWRAAGVAVPRVAVNVSALQLEAGFADEVLAVVQQHGLQPSDLELELTESLFAGDADEVGALLAPLRAAGVQLALDDFGTGFSSLSALHRLPIDVLKIDRSFVCDLGSRDSADAVARSIVALARALGKRVVAEGVETEAQHQLLLALGSDELQGYLYSRPLPAPALEEWLQHTLQPA
jgi:diguanylate cyclase (GGDEF)-like protein